MGYLDSQGNYYEGDRISPLDVEALPPLAQNYQGLAAALRGTELFGKVYSAAESGDPTIQTPMFLLTSTLNSVAPNLNDLYFSLLRLKQNMGSRLTTDDIAVTNQVLAANGFTLVL